MCNGVRNSALGLMAIEEAAALAVLCKCPRREYKAVDGLAGRGTPLSRSRLLSHSPAEKAQRHNDQASYAEGPQFYFHHGMPL